MLCAYFLVINKMQGSTYVNGVPIREKKTKQNDVKATEVIWFN